MKQADLKITQVGLMLVGVPLVGGFLFIVTLACLIWQAETEIKQEDLQRSITLRASFLMGGMVDTTTASAGAMFIGDKRMVQLRNTSRDAVIEELGILERLVANNPAQQISLDRIRAAVYDQLEAVQQVENKFAEGMSLADILSTARVALEIRHRMQDVNKAIDTLVEGGRKIEQEGPAARARSRQWIELALYGGFGLNVLVGLGLAAYFSRGITGRLNVLIDNASRLATQQPLNEEMKGSNEISQFDRVFHTMVLSLADADRAKQALVSTVSHELKTPLASLDATLTLVEAGALGEVSAPALVELQSTQKDIRHLISLITDLLDVERMEAGKLPMSFAQVPISKVFERALENVRASAAEKSISLVMPAGDITIYADETRLARALTHLLGNAIKFSPVRSTVTVAMQEWRKAVEIAVSDQGPGIAPEEREAIFDRLRQVKRQEGEESSSVGLGLPLCKAIVHQHGGTISVTSESGEGSAFRILLPLRDGEAQPAPVHRNLGTTT